MASCRTQVPIHHNTKDSVRVEYRTIDREVLRIDTVKIHLPQEVKEVVRVDSSSLHTSLALSTAKIQADGKLYHTLSNKLQHIPKEVIVKDRIVIRDSVIYKNKVEVKEVAVRMPPTKWQVLQMWGGRVFAVLMLGALAVFIVKRFVI